MLTKIKSYKIFTSQFFCLLFATFYGLIILLFPTNGQGDLYIPEKKSSSSKPQNQLPNHKQSSPTTSNDKPSPLNPSAQISHSVPYEWELSEICSELKVSWEQSQRDYIRLTELHLKNQRLQRYLTPQQHLYAQKLKDTQLRIQREKGLKDKERRHLQEKWILNLCPPIENLTQGKNTHTE